MNSFLYQKVAGSMDWCHNLISNHGLLRSQEVKYFLTSVFLVHEKAWVFTQLGLTRLTMDLLTNSLDLPGLTSLIKYRLGILFLISC